MGEMRFTKIIYCHTGNMVIETEQWCVLLTVSKWCKQTVHHTHIYKLEMITNVLSMHLFLMWKLCIEFCGVMSWYV